MPSPESPANRIATRSRCWICLATYVDLLNDRRSARGIPTVRPWVERATRLARPSYTEALLPQCFAVSNRRLTAHALSVTVFRQQRRHIYGWTCGKTTMTPARNRRPGTFGKQWQKDVSPAPGTTGLFPSGEGSHRAGNRPTRSGRFVPRRLPHDQFDDLRPARPHNRLRRPATYPTCRHGAERAGDTHANPSGRSTASMSGNMSDPASPAEDGAVTRTTRTRTTRTQ